MRRICWFGIYEDDKLIVNFPQDAEKLSEIFTKIEDGEIKGDEYGKKEPPTDWSYETLREAAILHMKRKLISTSREDSDIIEAIRFYDELTETLNIFSMRVKSWTSHDTIKDLSESYDRNKNIDDVIKLMDKITELRKSIEKYIDMKMREIAPNIREICGPIIGAKLISLAGGLEKLAYMPSSTIQVLGAEKALFFHIKKGAKPPKHGILYQHPLIQNSPKKLRGKIARSMAAKIAIAARLDLNLRPAYDKLKEDLAERVQKVLKK